MFITLTESTTLILVLRAIHFDEKLRSDPQRFEPSRYLKSSLPAADYINVNDPYERDHFAYGAGRRVCPGVHVAERSLYINIVRTLWGFNVAKSVDTDGNTIEPNTAMVRGFLSVPEVFKAKINVRSPQHEKVIREAMKTAIPV